MINCELPRCCICKSTAHWQTNNNRWGIFCDGCLAMTGYCFTKEDALTDWVNKKQPIEYKRFPLNSWVQNGFCCRCGKKTYSSVQIFCSSCYGSDEREMTLKEFQNAVSEKAFSNYREVVNYVLPSDWKTTKI